MTIGEFIEANGIGMTCSYMGFRADKRGWGHDAWRCILRMDGRRMQVTFTMGTGLKGREPTVEDVLDSLASDAVLLENSQWNLDQFMSEAGCDFGEARGIFNATARQTKNLQRLLGYDAELYEQFLWHAERL